MTTAELVPNAAFPSAVEALTYDADDLAALLKCSVRQIWRLRDRGALPAHLRLGKLVRWPRKIIDDWIAAGAPAPARR
ncbi:MAG: helix-turn-helix domain-containing protein [Gemmataceae bacterium]|nr:helix-turn-helix domain-containing protein [Gemmataceae bacterium]